MPDIITVVNMIPNGLSGETNQDSETNLAVNPANPLEIVGSAFTPSPNAGSKNSPLFYSNDGGNTWNLRDLIAGTPVRDQSVRFAEAGGNLYAGVLWGSGSNIAAINFDILRTNDFSGATTMTQVAQRTNDDQPFVAATTVPSGPDAGKDRVYVASNDHGPANVPATVDLSLDANAAAATTTTLRLEDRVVSRDGFPTRSAVHPDGTVYAAYYSTTAAGSAVVIVRDDDWGNSASPFDALIDTGDGKRGVRIATAVNNPYSSLALGQQRIGSDLAIAVDPTDSATVYVCWGDLQNSVYTLYVRKSTDSGVTWSGNLRTIANATNPALAITSDGRLGFLYQQVTGLAPGQRWETTLELTHSDFGSSTAHVLSNTPANTPAQTFTPYLGDYLSMMSVGRSFYGIFTANNSPDNANFPNGVTYQRNANFTTKTLLANDHVTSVPVSIDPFFFKLSPATGRVVTAIADAGSFGDVCRGTFRDETLTIDNGGDGPLSITSISSSSPAFLAPSVLSYPVKLGPGDSIDVTIRFEPKSFGPVVGTITITSDDPAGPHKVHVSGVAPTPRLSLIIAHGGDFGPTCIGTFADQPLVLNNSGMCPVTISGIVSSSVEFFVPDILVYPLALGPGDALAVPIRFEPRSHGLQTGTITVTSSDPGSPHKVSVKGEVPSGKLAVTGSLCFGGVKACCRAERTLSICNVGHCALHVTKVAFKRKNPHWKLVNNPFPATLPPGMCLGVVVRYKATEKCPIACELVIESDDPATPVKTLDVMAYTVWRECTGKRDCDCRRCGCESCEGDAEDCGCDEDEGDDDER
ncbi:MAG TPA: choice-of-anchor D domain-containing protein [Solirubrobacteraceae bacterium]|jgi:hypothetical protein|nr:choice-of-anchor D domain-containing protein [Solirubrobacteraceae bacterium]